MSHNVASAALYIRPARPEDSAALSYICLLTGDAGISAEPKVSIKELIGLIYAVPYVNVPHTCGFVLVHRKDEMQQGTDAEETVSSPADGENASEEVVGYILCATDTPAFEAAEEAQWWPPLRAKYPLDYEPPSGTVLTELDKHLIKLFHKPDPYYEACLAYSPAHMHIDILAPFQRQGWGRRLIDRLVAHLRDETSLTHLWLCMDPRNVEAAKFYIHIGFEQVPGAPETCVGLPFDQWRG